MIQKPFDAITKLDIDALIADKLAESRTLEYKQELPGNSDGDKREFLADVSSFANASGGDILYGIKPATNSDGKKTGDPESVLPIAGITSDAAKLRLEEIIRQGIEPRMRVQINEITGWNDDGNGFVILIRIPKSFASPHMVTYKGSSRFFSRNSAGKYPLDVHEIRSAVLATDSQAERIKQFRQDRLSKIIADETPVVLSTPHRLVLHMIPIANFLNRERINLSKSDRYSVDFRPMASGWNRRHNLDGYLTWTAQYRDSKNVQSYCQLFHDGSVETVDSELLQIDGDDQVNGKTGYIPSVAYEKDIIEVIQSYLKSYSKLDISGPFTISLTILNCKGSYLATSQRIRSGQQYTIDRDVVMLPDIAIEGVNVDVPRVLKPVFDAVWNMFGYPQSCNYDTEGNWQAR